MSCKLYYRKFCLNAPKVYSSKTDVHSNRKCKILFCKCVSTNFELVSKFTSYSLYLNLNICVSKNIIALAISFKLLLRSDSLHYHAWFVPGQTVRVLKMFYKHFPQTLFVASHAIKKASLTTRFFNGRRSRTRTHDQRFWRPRLYQLSYSPM